MVWFLIKNSAHGPLSNSFLLKDGGFLLLLGLVGIPGKFTSDAGRVPDPGSSKKAGEKTSIIKTLKVFVPNSVMTAYIFISLIDSFVSRYPVQAC